MLAKEPALSVAVVTGATGFIGSHLTRRLISSGWQVHALKRSTSSLDLLRDVKSAVVYHDVDRHSHDSIWQAIGGDVDVVFHLATNYGRDEQLLSQVVESNVLFPLRLLEHSNRRDVPLFIATDTCFTPDYPYLQPYTTSKKQFVTWARLNSQNERDENPTRRFVNLVLQHPFGPADQAGKFVPWIMQQCLNNTKTIDLTDGKQQKDFVFVDDVVDALLKLFHQRDDLPTGFQQIACGSGAAIPVRQFVETVHRLSNSISELRFGELPAREGEVAVSVADVTVLNELGWTAKTTLEEAIQFTLTSMLPC